MKLELRTKPKDQPEASSPRYYSISLEKYNETLSSILSLI
jgi:hypothetical protein